MCLMDSLRLEVTMAEVVVERGPPNGQAQRIFSHGSWITFPVADFGVMLFLRL